MFTDNILSNSVVQLGNTLLSNIDGSGFDGDYSIITATRLLLYPRLKEGEKHATRFYAFNSAKETLKAAIDEIDFDTEAWSKMYILYDTTSRREFLTNTENMTLEGFEAPELINVYAKEKFAGRILINKDRRTTIIMITNPTSIKQHYICAVLPVLLPWCHFDEKPLGNLEFAYLESFLGDDYQQNQNLFNELYRALELEKYVLRNTMMQLSESIRRKRERQLTQQIDNNRTEINVLMNQIFETQGLINKLSDELFGVVNRTAADPTDEMLKFLERTKNVKLESVDDDGNLLLFISGDLVNYPDAITTLIGNHGSPLYQTNRGGLSQTDLNNLMLAIFDKQELTVRLGAYFIINPYMMRVSPNGHTRLESITSNNCLPNSHLYHFNCLGGNSTAIARKMQEGDIIGTMMQCQASVSSLNLREPPSFSHFIYDLLHLGVQCIRLPDGTYVNAKEAVRYLTQKENQDE